MSAQLAEFVADTLASRGRSTNGSGRPPQSPQFFEIDKDTGCWVWARAVNHYGYGVIRCPERGRTVPAHKWVYEMLHGPVPPGKELDHLCRNRACCNPAHLEPVIHAVNMQRGTGAFSHEEVRIFREIDSRRPFTLAERQAIARDRGITEHAVYMMLTGRTYKNVKPR